MKDGLGLGVSLGPCGRGEGPTGLLTLDFCPEDLEVTEAWSTSIGSEVEGAGVAGLDCTGGVSSEGGSAAVGGSLGRSQGFDGSGTEEGWGT